jgi:hypothetical protein
MEGLNNSSGIRGPLWALLDAYGYQPEFVGPFTTLTGDQRLVPMQIAHGSKGGTNIGQLTAGSGGFADNGIAAMISTYTPDVIVVAMGANGTADKATWDALFSAIFAVDPDVVVVAMQTGVYQIVSNAPYTDGGWAGKLLALSQSVRDQSAAGREINMGHIDVIKCPLALTNNAYYDTVHPRLFGNTRLAAEVVRSLGIDTFGNALARLADVGGFGRWERSIMAASANAAVHPSGWSNEHELVTLEYLRFRATSANGSVSVHNGTGNIWTSPQLASGAEYVLDDPLILGSGLAFELRPTTATFDARVSFRAVVEDE